MQQVNENFIFEQGSDPEVLLILFTGFAQRLSLQPFAFLQVSGLYNYSRILIRDPSFRMCLCGVGGELDSMEKVVAEIRRIAEQLKARRLITVGSSGGGHSALLYAHLLKADYAHSFAPFTNANVWRFLHLHDWVTIRHFWRTVLKLNCLPTGVHRYYDLRKVLSHWNGHTRYYVHVCRQHRWDYPRARHLEGLPHVDVLAHPCDQHAVIRHIVRQKLIRALFDGRNQDRIPEMFAEAYQRSGEYPAITDNTDG